MADAKATLLIRLKDEVSAGLKKMEGGMGDFARALGAATAAGGALLAFLGAALNEWGKQEAAIAKLNNALKNVPGATQDTSKNLLKLADDLAKVTTATDDSIIEQEALLATFGMTEKQITDLIPRILDLSAATGVDLHSATVALGKAIQTGSGAALSRYGIVIDDAMLKSRDFSGVMGVLDQKFGGSAEELAKLTQGGLKNMAKAVGEVMESIGRLIATGMNPWIRKFTELSNALAGFLGDLAAVSEQNVETGKTAQGLLKIQHEQLAMIKAQRADLAQMGKQKALSAAQQKELMRLTDQQNRLEKAMHETSRKASAERQQDRKDEARAAQDAATATNQAQDSVAQKAEETSQTFRERMTMAATDWQDVFVSTTQNVVQEFSSGMADMIVNGGKFSMSMEEIGRRILQYFVQQVIAQMVSAWLANLAIMETAYAAFAAKTAVTAGVGGAGAAGGAGGAVAGGLAGAGIMGADYAYGQKNGLTQKEGIIGTGALTGMGGSVGLSGAKKVAKKIKKKFSGGVINEPTAMLGLRTGSIGLAGETGVPEGIFSFPELGMTSAGGRSAMFDRAGGGGGGPTIVIQAGTIVADKMSVLELARRIEQEIFRFQRNRESYT